MKKVIAYFKLMRVLNLLIIGLSFYFIRYYLIREIYKFENLELQMSDLNFFIFVLGYLLLIAGAYVLNNCVDYEIDKINKPDNVIVGKEVSLANCKIIYYTVLSIGFLLSAYVVYAIKAPKLLFVVIIIMIMLWLYSMKYKKEFLVGNLIVAAFAFVSVLLPWLYEFYAGVKTANIPIIFFNKLNNVILIYATFAFITNLIREIVKDIVDMKGDEMFGCETLPIKIGIKKTKIVLFFIFGLLIVFITYILIILNANGYKLVKYYGFVILFIILYTLFKLIQSKEIKDFVFVSDLLKILMVAGIFSMQVLSIEL